jgi:quercetin dioxygenase-like cupin family protein
MEIGRISDKTGSFAAFPGVTGKVLFSGGRLMFLWVEVKGSKVVPEHSHPHEQMGICLSGRAEFRAGEETRIVDAGTVYWFRSNEKHSVRALGEEGATFLDVFSPPREDYLQKAKI